MKSICRTLRTLAVGGAALTAACVCIASKRPVQAAAAALPARLLVVFAVPADAQAPPAARAKTAPQPDIPLPEGKGRDLTKKMCGTCHSNNVWAAQRHTADKWSSIVDNMVSKGLEASDDDLTIVNDYLAANFAPAKKGEPPAPAPASDSPSH